MTTFIETAASRETSVEIMEAIWEVCEGDEDRANKTWMFGPYGFELEQIIEIVTKDGSKTTDFVWGVLGDQWEVGLKS